MSETVTLHAAGSIPGIPGQHGPGTYTVDWEARTATPVPVSTPEAEPTTVKKAVNAPTTSEQSE